MDRLEDVITDVIDCGFHIHKQLGPGLLESVYETVLATTLQKRGYAVDRQKPVEIQFDDMTFREGFRADIVVNEILLVELKSTERMAPVYGKQVLTYLRLMNLPIGLLMNFGCATFKEGLKRIANNYTPTS
ncbi:GxxExxY protein [Parasphingorhabdus marina DSM 22363]|uniref:GxxExxY protein n=1 Tax=Parasphingorhabdus marina DSM 22363 TaxID=1123272 RepID=A0A1N6CLZ8_9SPHN|nr:GxxExxY protein [Parasphingorhabdus marina DSM 22363]